MPFAVSLSSACGLFPTAFGRNSHIDTYAPSLPDWSSHFPFLTIAFPLGGLGMDLADGRASLGLSASFDLPGIRLGNGFDIFIGFGPLGPITGGRGTQIVITDGFVEAVDLGRGRDVLIADVVEAVDMGRGRDTLILKEGAAFVDMGRGHDTLIFSQDANPISQSAADAPPSVFDGGAGRDRFIAAQSLGDFDFAFDDDVMILRDRLTGVSAEVTGFEEFVFDDQTYSAQELAEVFSGILPNIFASGGTQNVSVNDPTPGINTVWNRAVIEAVINTDLPSGPTVASRAYAMVHTAIYDAWAAFDDVAIRIAEDGAGMNQDNEMLSDAIITAGLLNDEGTQAEAMSYAAHGILSALYPGQQDLFDSVLQGRYGLDLPADATSLASQVGIDAAEDLMAQRLDDGANQAGLFADTTGYMPQNPDPTNINDIERWTPENVPIDPEDDLPVEQSFLTPHWGDVEGFALDQTGGELQIEKALADPDVIAKFGATGLDVSDLDAPPEPFFTEAFAGSTLDFVTKTITPIANWSGGLMGVPVDVSKALIGEIINPAFIAQAEVVLEYSASLGDPANASTNVLAPSGDAGKISAEFYEDGPGTGFPPGTWMVNAEFVAARDDLPLDQEVLLFLGVGNAVFDAGIATWEAKVAFDYARPVRVIRELAELGLIGEEDFDYKGEFGQVVHAYIPEIGETGLVLGREWNTYQTPGGDPSPPFAEYTSGHSAFSAAGAAALRAFTGSDDFGGAVSFPEGSTLFEPGDTPADDFTIMWPTFSDAADAAGLSRLFGGIHFEEGDFNGRAIGDFTGQNAYDLAELYYTGSIA